MALKRLSSIVHAFMAKWLLLPALLGLMCGAALWIGFEAQDIRKKQQHYAQTAAEHVNAYLKQSSKHLKFFALVYREKGFTESNLASFPEYSPTIQTILLLDSSGNVVYAAPEQAQQDVNYRGVLQSASIQERLYLTPPYYSIFHEEIVVSMVQPASGNRMLLAELDLWTLRNSLQRMSHHMEGGTVFLTDAYGNLLAHPNMSLVNQQVNLGNLDIISSLSNGGTTSGFLRRKGSMHFMSATEVRMSNWKVGVEQQALPLFAPSLWTITLSLTALLAMLGTAALLFDRRLQRVIVAPLTRFTNELNALRQGHEPPEQREEGPGFDYCAELWSLREHFSHMLEAVQKREAELRASEEDHRTTLYSIGDGVIVTDASGLITRMNPAAQELTAWQWEEAHGRPLSEVLCLVNVQTREYCESPVAKVLHTGEQQGLANHTALIARDGREYQIADSASPIRDDQGNITGVVFVFRDITEKYQQEEALRESQRTMQTLLSNLPGMAYKCLNSPEWPMEFVSRGCEDLTGYTAEELTTRGGMEYGDLIHQEDAQRVLSQVQEAVERERAFEIEYRIGTKHGEERWVWEKGRAVGKDASGREILEGFVTDITEYKEFQERLNFLSFHDSLTGLYNRNFFEEEMNRLGDGRCSPVGIIVCDLDGLKFINDTLGHQSGDSMLINTADILRNNFRSSDIISRIGGDEFAILLTETSQKITDDLMLRLRRSVEEHNSRNQGIPLSLSLGSAVSDPGPVNMYALFRDADNRMYREKIQTEESARSAAVQALTSALEARDFITEGHSQRLQELTASLARSLNLSESTINDLMLLAQFHDLGKVGVPDRILFKPGPLTDEEMREMQKHCEIGHRIAHSVPELRSIADWILYHHEWWDGRGYPRGLRGEDIPLPCRILSIADAYDTMISDRPYKKAMSSEEAVRELQRCAGTQFDPYLVEQFVALLQGFRNE
jgi:diguanylate cyclase (GGDEF)-like protein/PAS domain S-box-containing protein